MSLTPLTQTLLIVEQLRSELREIERQRSDISKKHTEVWGALLTQESIVHDAISGHCPGDVVEVSEVLYKIELVNLRRKLVPFTPRKLQ